MARTREEVRQFAMELSGKERLESGEDAGLTLEEF